MSRRPGRATRAPFSGGTLAFRCVGLGIPSRCGQVRGRRCGIRWRTVYHRAGGSGEWVRVGPKRKDLGAEVQEAEAENGSADDVALRPGANADSQADVDRYISLRVRSLYDVYSYRDPRRSSQIHSPVSSRRLNGRSTNSVLRCGRLERRAGMNPTCRASFHVSSVPQGGWKPACKARFSNCSRAALAPDGTCGETRRATITRPGPPMRIIHRWTVRSVSPALIGTERVDGIE